MYHLLFSRAHNSLLCKADILYAFGLIFAIFYFYGQLYETAFFLFLFVANIARLYFRYLKLSHKYSINPPGNTKESDKKIFTYKDRRYPQWIEIFNEDKNTIERLYFIDMLKYVNGQVSEKDIPDTCRNIYYGAMYGIDKEKVDKLP